MNQYAASHTEPLDEAYEVLGRKYAEMDRQCVPSNASTHLIWLRRSTVSTRAAELQLQPHCPGGTNGHYK